MRDIFQWCRICNNIGAETKLVVVEIGFWSGYVLVTITLKDKTHTKVIGE
jgi:hypothetical protein